ncbi:sensor domain-containing phosphodiesterase [Pseudofrankia inefficax]|uniref:Diguanylate phosphodiesterase with GAF sensor(S) n=1 Tax=Pseudofrankia inefficax (strain DSM 45817 / CECT 9037 / DDB 130130 / EuI1c) TaxID=298654 RepID=E3IXE3_PSEI1|nr:EAL domain-containing protein [Pseudofrankia inefficax]ADP85043.1 diguanylate phosphodiesterase with GAF sensor(s) [Pseudofrankia inefficax]
MARNRKATFGPELPVPEQDRAVADLLEAVRHRLGMDVVWLARAEGDLMVVEALDGDGESFGVSVGARMHHAATAYPRVISGELPALVRDVRGHDAVRRLPAVKALRSGAYVSATVFERDGAFYGVLTAVAHDPCPDLQERDVRFLRLAAEMIADSVSDLPRMWERRRAYWDRINAVIDAGGPDMVYQPIADLRPGGRVVGVEALARFPPYAELAGAGPGERPAGFASPAQAGGDRTGSGGSCGSGNGTQTETERWFACAAAVGLGVELEFAAVRAALAELGRLPPGVFLSVNVSPNSVRPGLVDLIGEVEPSRLLLEITEHNQLEAESEALRVIGEVRARGVRIGADDVGSGYAGLAQFLVLRPDLVKMDRFLTHGIDSDPARQVIARALIQVADEIGATMLAEGIETPEELATVRAARVRLGQGNYIAPPDRLSSAPKPGRRGPRQAARWPESDASPPNSSDNGP